MNTDSSPEAFTFLFTDLEGSTRMWEEQSDAMADALVRHDTILREAIGAYGGEVFATMGDGLAAAFDRPASGLAAALGAQLMLAAERWGTSGPLRVRMALHTGPARRRGGDYLGSTLNRCARLMAIGHGDQVLVSAATRQLVWCDLPPAAALEDRGEHRLRDLSGTEHVFQLTHPGLVGEFPPLRSLDAFLGNLPQQLTSFVGRQGEVAAVAGALRSARLLTLTGAGGVGKTRLALQVAAEVLPRYVDGAWLCDLAPVADPGAVDHALASALRVSQSPGLSVTGSLVEALRTRRMLAVVDNCEHLLEPVGRLVETLVQYCPHLVVLATSREALTIEGERIWPLRPLEVPPADGTTEPARVEQAPAVGLFVDRARAVRPDFVLSEANAGLVAEICRRLDGLPLAIELAAARVASLSPSDIARRLDERFRLLTGGRRTALERHRTLRGTVEWSYEMLGKAERRLFDRLSVFAGGCSLEAIEAVCSGGAVEEGEIVDLVASLVAKSLVVAEEASASVRYSLLETLRQYGAERLQESGEAKALQRRHAAHFAAFAHGAGSGLRGPEEAWWVGRLDQEFDNLRAGHGWAVAAGDADCALRIVGPLFWHAFWRLRSEIFSWAQAALELSGAADHPLLPSACALAGWGPVLRGDFALARRLSEEAFAAERQLGLAPDFPSRFLRGELLRLAGDLDTGAEHYEACVATARDKGDSWELAMVLAAHVYTLANGARLHEPHAEEAVTLARAVGNPTASAYALHSFGESLMEANPQRSLALHEAAAATAGSVGDSLLEGMALVSLTSLRGRLAEPFEALSGYLELIGRWQRQGSWLQQWILLRNLLELFARLDSYEPAAILYGAVEVSPAPPPRGGPEAERLARAISLIEGALGARRAAEEMARGRSMPKDDVVAYARVEIERLLATLGHASISQGGASRGLVPDACQEPA
jgi:predicted ATPase/class 3 adenylate cyclase